MYRSHPHIYPELDIINILGIDLFIVLRYSWTSLTLLTFNLHIEPSLTRMILLYLHPIININIISFYLAS